MVNYYNKKGYLQKGSMLITVLILLIIISLMAIAISQRVLLQQKMASNLHQSQVLHQQAETNLLLAERSIEEKDIKSLLSESFKQEVDYNYKDAKTWKVIMGSATDPSEVSVRYIIDKLEYFNDLDSGLGRPKLVESSYYRVTARSSEAFAGTFVILQSFYRH